MVIWSDILGKVNIVSKSLQSENMLIDIAMTKIKGLIASFEEYRETGFRQGINTAKKLASSIKIDPIFPDKRHIYRKRKFDELSGESSQTPQESAEEAFRIHYFLYIVDQTIGSLKKRFEQYEEYEDLFGFLFTSDKLNSLVDEDLKARCKNLERKLQRKEGSGQADSDLDGDELSRIEDHTTSSTKRNKNSRCNTKLFTKNELFPQCIHCIQDIIDCSSDRGICREKFF